LRREAWEIFLGPGFQPPRAKLTKTPGAAPLRVFKDAGLDAAWWETRTVREKREGCGKS